MKLHNLDTFATHDSLDINNLSVKNLGQSFVPDSAFEKLMHNCQIMWPFLLLPIGTTQVRNICITKLVF